jgi:hypothetical protein
MIASSSDIPSRFNLDSYDTFSAKLGGFIRTGVWVNKLDAEPATMQFASGRRQGWERLSFPSLPGCSDKIQRPLSLSYLSPITLLPSVKPKITSL